MFALGAADSASPMPPRSPSAEATLFSDRPAAIDRIPPEVLLNIFAVLQPGWSPRRVLETDSDVEDSFEGAVAVDQGEEREG